ncbi:MAG: nucleotide sugar dehydrogenase [Massilibacteroides sp.]|nr:nucleotide sugar dehydrogenase [Massilibacteroides sp.]MDD3062261.1 nucleotide sugar dehydrogenase [Massilibacteroides sp.]MDD4114000.1 nucleotide sugar dehydrogenase [Massilibacteroides sp.]MDD4660034.1 nucleotide sugar dehydrogenase [Massilibacteroides sp.]
MDNLNITIVGLGYVGLPLAVEFAKKYRVIGFDIDMRRINELKNGYDRTGEIDRPQLTSVLSNSRTTFTGLLLTDNPEVMRFCSIYIVTVPTPITTFKSPNLQYLLAATKIIGNLLKKEDIVIYESTVYPGCTEEDCVPVLEEASGLTYNRDFFCGYSPERVNPGDKKHTIKTIKKVVSGSTPAIAEKIAKIYASIIPAGIYKASSIKIAEASKAIENAQRDVNISFVNELALIFDKMGIDTQEVLEAAATKWNFLKFKPGLVGGHCISVDPYYLLHKSQCLGYNPRVILSGRSVNDEMGRFVASKVVKLMIQKNILIANSKVLILGFSFKENCPDIRNTKVMDVIYELNDFGVNVDVYDPHVLRDEALQEYKISLLEKMPSFTNYNGIIVAVAHDEFKQLDFSFIKKYPIVLFDVKGIIDKELVHGRL